MFLINPYWYSAILLDAVEGNDSYTVLLLNMDGTDASTTFTDSSIGGSTHTITANGDAQVDTAQQVFGTGSLLLDGIGDYLTIQHNDDLNLEGNDFVIETWVKYNTHTGTPLIYSKTGATKSIQFYYYNDQNRFEMVYSTNGSTWTGASWTFAPSNSVWYWIVLSRDGANLRFYVNGNKIGTTHNIGSSVINSITDDARIGIADCFYDEYRISTNTNRGWTGETIPVPTGPYTKDVSDYIALYKFEDNGNDETGNHTATMSNVTYSDTGGITGQGKYGIWNGTTSYGQVTDHADITDIKTVSCWFYADSYGEGGDYGRIFAKDTRDTLFHIQNAYMSFFKNFSGGLAKWSSPASSISLSTWIHVAYTYAMDDNTTTNPIIYINGVSVTVTEISTPVGTMVSDTGKDIYIGNRLANDKTFDGRIENLRLYNRVLTPAEIQSIYDEENT